MVKILHIGHTYTPHVYDVIEQIENHTDFYNAVLSCQTKQLFPNYFPKHIPIYVHNYLDYLDTPKMRSAVDSVLSIEKPDIIIGHSFSQVAVILNYALTVMNVPAMAFIWGRHDCIKNFKSDGSKRLYYNNLTVLKKLNYLVCTNRWLNLQAVKGYGITLDDFIDACPPVNLAQYTDHIPDTSYPKLLLGKPRGDKFIYPCLYNAFKLFPKLEVHAFNSPSGISLAKKFNVYKKIIFYKSPQTQDNFSNIIKKCNIVSTITGDPGTGGTAMQATYAGCINLMRRCQSSKWMIEDNINAIMCIPKVKDVQKKLFYIIKNLSALSKKFKNNSRHLIKYDRENTWQNLYKGIINCLEGKKEKIFPTAK